MNIFEFAMKMELDGKAYYEKLVAETAVVGLKTIFTNLAADEQKRASGAKTGTARVSAELSAKADKPGSP